MRILNDKHIKAIEEEFGIKLDPKPYEHITLDENIYVFDCKDRFPYLEIKLSKNDGQIIQMETTGNVVKAMKKLLEILEDKGETNV